MQIDLSQIDRTQFNVQPHEIAGETCFLVTPPHVGTKWTKDNLIFRSSLWNAQGEPVSLSWKKHFNWEEQPDIDPAPTDLTDVELPEKIDGSTLLISRYKDVLITRTRGTVDATKMDNGDEIALFKERHPRLFDLKPSGLHIGHLPRYSYTVVCEWVSPRNQIVIAYPEPDLYLTGIILHDDYSYVGQDTLDRIAADLGVKRPRRYRFNTIPEMLESVKAFEGVEGVCAYYNGGQSWRKAKAAQYLALHRFKERVSLPNMLDLFFAYSCPKLDDFLARIEKEFDHECLTMARELVTAICAADAAVIKKVMEIKEIVHWKLVTVTDESQLYTPLSRRDAALAIQAKWTDLYRGVAFRHLDNREIDLKMWRKLIEHELGI